MIRAIFAILMLVVWDSAFAQPIHVIDFESPSASLELDSINPDNIWQIGEPDKVIFNSAYSPVNAIVTDTFNPYPNGNHSTFTVGFELYGVHPRVSFQHRLETPNGMDGGYIEISKDSGTTWQLLTDTSGQGSLDYDYIYGLQTFGFPGIGDTLFNGQGGGFSGSSSGSWNYSVVEFPCIAIKKAFRMYLRFNFISDTVQDSLDGWMIDDITIDNDGGCGNLGEDVIASLNVAPNPITSQCTLYLEDHYLSDGTLEVYSMQGKLVLKKTGLYGDQLILDLHNLPGGFYQAVVKDGHSAWRAAARLVFSQ